MIENKWDKDRLFDLYYHQHLTLEEIGIRYHVSRERVRQVMEKLGIKRLSSRPQHIVHISPVYGYRGGVGGSYGLK